MVERCQKFWLYQKMFHIKIVPNWISYKKVRGPIRLSPLGVELEGSKVLKCSEMRKFTLEPNAAKITSFKSFRTISKPVFETR